MFLCENLPDGYDKTCPMEESLDKYKTFNPKNVIKRAAGAKKNEVLGGIRLRASTALRLSNHGATETPS
jgi:hypothetical protein